jgi:hypothetical protein
MKRSSVARIEQSRPERNVSAVTVHTFFREG